LKGAIPPFGRSLRHYKVPLQIRFVEQFPMTVTGKIQKFILR